MLEMNIKNNDTGIASDSEGARRATGGATGMVVSQLVKVQPSPCEKGRSR